MRIAITHPYSWPEVRRGAERIVVETARSLAARGHKVTILTAGSKPGRSVAGGVRTIRLRRLTEDSWRHERTFAMRIVPYLMTGRYDVVHSMMAYDAQAAVRARWPGGYKVVFDDMGITEREWLASCPDGDVRTRLIATVDVYGCMSQHALDVLTAEWGRQGVLIPGGVRLDQFQVSSEREPQPTILFSGSLAEPRKGVPLLLEAAAILIEEEPRLKVWLSGPGDPKPLLDACPPSLRGAVEALPLGEPQEQGRRYGRAWLTALPSKWDSFGMVLIESLASGTPIVVLDHAAPPALVTPGTGAIAKPDDPESLASALREAFELARKPETAGRCRDFAAQFDWDRAIAPLLEGIYERAIAG